MVIRPTSISYSTVSVAGSAVLGEKPINIELTATVRDLVSGEYSNPFAPLTRACTLVFFPDDLAAFASMKANNQIPANIQERFREMNRAFAFWANRGCGCD
jgi:hypothetical protein